MSNKGRSISVNTRIDQHLVDALTSKSKDLIHTVLRDNEITKGYNNIDTMIVGTFLYKKTRDYIEYNRELDINIESLMENLLLDAIKDLNRLVKLDESIYSAVQRLVRNPSLNLTSFYNISEEDILNFYNSMEMEFIPRYIIPDTMFTLRLFNIKFGHLVSHSKIINLRRLYNNILTPIIKYCKEHYEVGNSILEVIESIDDRTEDLLTGNAVSFMLRGVDANSFFEDLNQERIDINYKELYLLETSAGYAVYVSQDNNDSVDKY